MNQDQTFAQTESDRYFRRNLQGVMAKEMDADLPIRLLQSYNLRPATVLEIGALNGYRLDACHRRFGSACTAVEPSADAIADGMHRYPEVTFVQATAAEVPLQEPYDLVIVNFVLHWIDRETLLRSVAEIDRLVKDGGHLIIGDFAPANKHRVPYHHKPGVWTYKQDYAGLFVGTGLYHQVAMLSARHGGVLDADVPEHDRTSCCLLQKRLTDHYEDKGA